MSSFPKFLVIGLIIFPVIVLAAAPGVPDASGVPAPLVLNILRDFITSLINNALWAIFAGIAIILFMYAGILFLTAAGDAQKLTQARHAFLWGVVGVAVMILAFSIFTIIQTATR